MALVNIHYASMTIKNIKQSEAMTVGTLLDTWIILLYRKLTLVLIKVFQIKLARIEGKNYFPIKEINAKEVIKFKTKGN